MYCRKCGIEQKDDAKFCPSCGMAHMALGEDSKSIVTQQVNVCKVTFYPRKIFGQWMISKAGIVVNGQTHITKFKKPLEILVPSGKHDIICYAKYMGMACKKQLTFQCEVGHKYKITYKTAFLIFLSGKVTVETTL